MRILYRSSERTRTIHAAILAALHELVLFI